MATIKLSKRLKPIKTKTAIKKAKEIIKKIDKKLQRR